MSWYKIKVLLSLILKQRRFFIDKERQNFGHGAIKVDKSIRVRMNRVLSKPTVRPLLCFPARPRARWRSARIIAFAGTICRTHNILFRLIPAHSTRLLFQSGSRRLFERMMRYRIHTIYARRTLSMGCLHRRKFVSGNVRVGERSSRPSIFFSANCCLACGKSCFSRSIAGSDHRNPTYSRILLFSSPFRLS